MYTVLSMLEIKEKNNEHIQVGMVGCGQMGSGMVNITYQMPGLRIKAIADLDVERGISAFQEVGYDSTQIVVSEKESEAQSALEKGKVIVTPDAILFSKIPSLDAIIEATGSPEVGAMVAFNGILSGKHIIMLNVETDVTVGLILKKMADSAGVVYTVSAGDEPGAIIELYRFAKALGFQIVCAGKGKNNPINHFVTPDNVQEEALKKNMNPKMLCSFIDGTKTMVEMAEVSNSTGALPDIPGMHGENVSIENLNKRYVPKKEGGIFEKNFVVDYSTGKVAPGVFLVISTPIPHLQKDLEFYSMGEGPYYTLYRPYHLCSFETPLSVARACILNEPTINSLNFHSEVVAIAKRDLPINHVIDGIGGHDIFGKIYSFSEAEKGGTLPIGLATRAKVKNQISRGDVIRYKDVEVDHESFVVKLREIQNKII